VGDAAPDEVAVVLNELWGDGETCIVVSSDLSHYHDYRTAQQMDRETARAIKSLNWQDLDGDQACGCQPICGLLQVAKERGLRCRTVDLRNSGDTSGRRDYVVGYGAFAFTED
jgi:AmmeMemoRadiSam system protein B